MALLTLGLNHNTAPVALREKLAFPTKEAIGTALSDLRGHLKSLAPEAAILSTCNRTEIYCKTDAPDEAGPALTEWIGRHKGVDGEGNLAEHLYLLPNQGAVRHAFRVASGLDSMVLGEPQILGQMKTAARVAQGEQIFENLADCSVLLIGAGEMIELCAAHWAPHPRRMVIANRTLERARPLAERFGATTTALSDLPQQLENFDVVISCTASSLPIIGLGMVERSVRQRRHRPVLMIDLAVPRDIEDEVSRLDDVFLYTVDDLREVVDAGLEGRRLAVAEAESIIDTQVSAFMNWMVQRQSVPLIQELHARGDAVRQQEVERARKMLAKGEDPAAVLEALSRALTAKFMHGPTTLLSRHAGKDPELANMLSGLLPVPRGGR